MPCIFCDIASKKEPASIVYEDDDNIAFMDIGQATNGHTLVIPKKHIENSDGLSESDAESLAKAVFRVAKAVKNSLGAEGVNILQNNGAAAGQHVMHLHFHVLPRFSGDGLEIHFPYKRPGRESLESLAQKVKGAF